MSAVITRNRRLRLVRSRLNWILFFLFCSRKEVFSFIAVQRESERLGIMTYEIIIHIILIAVSNGPLAC